MRTLSVDLGGSRAKLAVVEDGRVVDKDVFAVDRHAHMADTLEAIAAHAHALLEANASPALQGLGFAFPGIVDTRENRVVVSNGKYMDAAQTDFVVWAKRVFGLPLRMENDAAAALLGELAYGAGRGERDAVLLIIGTGIGTAASYDGRVLHGRHGTMGILGGHMAIDLEGCACDCGNIGCLEAHAGTWALQQLAERDGAFEGSLLHRAETVDYEALSNAYGQGDAVAVRLFEHVSRALGMGAVNLIHAYDPEALIISGGGARFAALLPAIEAYVHRHAWTPWGKVRLIAAENPEESVVLGLHKLLESAEQERKP